MCLFQKLPSTENAKYSLITKSISFEFKFDIKYVNLFLFIDLRVKQVMALKNLQI